MRAIVLTGPRSFIDYDKQYTVAEATKTLHLDDTSVADDQDDRLWIGVLLFLARAHTHTSMLTALSVAHDSPKDRYATTHCVPGAPKPTCLPISRSWI